MLFLFNVKLSKVLVHLTECVHIMRNRGVDLWIGSDPMNIHQNPTC